MFFSPFLALPFSVCSDSNPAVTGGLINWKGVGKDCITQRFSFTSRIGYLCALWKCPSQEEGFRSVSRKFLLGLYNGYRFLPCWDGGTRRCPLCIHPTFLCGSLLGLPEEKPAEVGGSLQVYGPQDLLTRHPTLRFQQFVRIPTLMFLLACGVWWFLLQVSKFQVLNLPCENTLLQILG